MKKALVDSQGVLMAHGFSDFKADPGGVVLDVPDDFSLPLGGAKWDGSKWSPYSPPAAPKTLSDGELGEVLVRKGLLAPSEIISSG